MLGRCAFLAGFDRFAVAADADVAEAAGIIQVVVHEAGDADHVAGLERAAGEVVVVPEGSVGPWPKEKTTSSA